MSRKKKSCKEIEETGSLRNHVSRGIGKIFRVCKDS